jgi:hypothetical protein
MLRGKGGGGGGGGGGNNTRTIVGACVLNSEIDKLRQRGLTRAPSLAGNAVSMTNDKNKNTNISTTTTARKTPGMLPTPRDNYSTFWH